MPPRKDNRPKGPELTPRQRELIERLNHPVFTPDYIESWIGRNDDVSVNAPAALSAIEAKGFFAAIRCLEEEMPDL